MVKRDPPFNLKFGDSVTRKFADDCVCPKQWQPFEEFIVAKLSMLDNVTSLKDLRTFPNNRLEALKGDLIGWYSIRIKNGVPWRIIFRWENNKAVDVKLTDYHKG